MTDQERNAMQMALEALESCDVDYDSEENPYNTFDAEDVSEAIDALRQALAQTEQEPVAYMTYKGYLYHASDPKVLEHSDPTPLYTVPPSKPWVSLTDEEIDYIYKQKHNQYGEDITGEYERELEAKLREKNT